MKLFFAVFVALVSLVLSSAVENGKQKVENIADKSYYKPYYPKYCHKYVCKDVETCKDYDCHCVSLDYVCGCDKEETYYFKKSGYSGGHPTFYKKTVCVDYKLCHYSKCKTCHKCEIKKVCKNVRIPCYGHH